MRCEQHLALEAILVGLRRTGVIDKRAMQTIVNALRETADKARVNCGDTADGLDRLADALTEGPCRSLQISVAA